MVTKDEPSSTPDVSRSTSANNFVFAAHADEAEIEFDLTDHKSFVVFGSFATKLPGPLDLVLTEEGTELVAEAIDGSLRDDEVVTGRYMHTGVQEVLHSTEEARDLCIGWSLGQPPEIGLVRVLALSTLLKLYRLVRRGAAYPDRY